MSTPSLAGGMGAFSRFTRVIDDSIRATLSFSVISEFPSWLDIRVYEVMKKRLEKLCPWAKLPVCFVLCFMMLGAFNWMTIQVDEWFSHV